MAGGFGTNTASNAAFTITIPGIIQGPQIISGFGVDNFLDNTAIANNQVEMGIDGFMAVGYMPQPFMMGITLLAPSPSRGLFDQWAAFSKALMEAFVAQGTLILPSVKKSYALFNGALTEYLPIPNVGKVLQPTKAVITWQDYNPIPYVGG